MHRSTKIFVALGALTIVGLAWLRERERPISRAASAPASQDSGLRAGLRAGLRVTTGPTAALFVYTEGLNGYFFPQDTIIRVVGEDHCVAHVRGPGPFSPAGALTVSRSSGGPPLTTEPRPNGAYGLQAQPTLFFPFPSKTPEILTMQSAGTESFPPLPPTTVRSSVVGPIRITHPELPPEGKPLGIPSSRPFEVTWEVPPNARDHLSENRMGVSLLTLTGGLYGEIHCGFDLASGRALVSELLLSEVKLLVQPEGPIHLGHLRLMVGDAREVTSGGVSYFIELGAAENTTLPDDMVFSLL
jgi:hypothetical protein